MALTGEEAYGLSTSYVDETLQGMGAIKGASCQIQNITDNLDGTHTVTFIWQDNAGASHTSTMTVSDGKDGKGIAGVTQSIDGKSITVVFDDGTMSAPMLIPTEKGDDGKSAYKVAVDNGFVGTEAEWLESLKGEQGETGEGVSSGGTTGQVLAKKSDNDYDTEWIDSGDAFPLTTEQMSTLISLL